MDKKIPQVQIILQNEGLNGWLLYDFRRINPLACQFLEIPLTTLLTRRFFYWIPKTGSPVKIVSAVENPLQHLPGKEEQFRSWQDLEEILKKTLQGTSQVAMEYSPDAAVPEISRVDGGTVDLVRKCGPVVVSSGDILQEINGAWSREKWQSHQFAANLLETIADNTWEWIGKHLKIQEAITEYDVQQYMLKSMKEHHCITAHPPICAVNEHSALPHYDPPLVGSAQIKEGDWILLDLWCKQDGPGAVYADITRVGVARGQVREKEQLIFDIVKKASDAAIAFVKERYAKKTPIFGFEVDQTCRNVIEEAGYGKQFVHRTGHNIDEEDHGPGAHIDNLETHDTRRLIPGTCFSIEPGIYLKGEFGVRLEHDVFLHPDGKVIVTGRMQTQIKLIL